MELSFRNYRVFSRLVRRPFGVHRTIVGTSVKEQTNPELLNKFNNDIQAGGAVPVFRRALLFPNRVALQDEVGIYTYEGIYQAAAALSNDIASQLMGNTERTIGYMCTNDASHVIVQWAIWMTGNIAVPLTPLHPPEMLKYFLTDSEASLVMCTSEYENLLRPIALDLKKPLLITTRDRQVTAQLHHPDSTFNKEDQSMKDVGKSNMWYGQNDAMLIYTSGTTSKPKGVVWSHKMLTEQISSLHAAWRYSCNDVVLHTLPLHHIHGQLNSLNASLAAGARIRMLGTFAAHTVWARLLGVGERCECRVSVLHGVPAMYAKLATSHATMFAAPRTAQRVRSVLSNMRLMCAGSAPLPDTLFRQWEEISGHKLLERYGMSEVGMALSNPYMPVEKRSVGCVGLPLPGVIARIATFDDAGNVQPLVTVDTPVPDNQISAEALGLSGKELFERSPNDWAEAEITVHQQTPDNVYQGELLLKGTGVFSRYWNRLPALSPKDFTSDGWFRTGDTASFSDNRFKILGRTSIDIIKTSGYKVSALQVESAILEHPDVLDAAVLGMEDKDYGETIATVVSVKDNAKLSLKELKEFLGKKLAPYQLPRTCLIVDVMPRNVMGKLDKKEIRKLYGEKLVLKKN